MLPPEMAHKLAEQALKRGFLWRALSPRFQVTSERLKVNLAGIELTNPIGVAAGLDKDCRFLGSLINLGFGYVTGGTITAAPKAGNPRPRLVRNYSQESLVNALSFPSDGLEKVASRLEKEGPWEGARILSVTGTTVDDFLTCHSRLEPLADAIELNISSPNTAGLKAFQESEGFKDLVEKINAQRAKPLFIKIPPFLDDLAREGVLSLVRTCVDLGVNGVTAFNTHPVQDSRIKVGEGGLSGRTIFPDTLRMLREVVAEAKGKLSVNACGGIFSGSDAWQALKAGATTVQLLTGLVYQGPSTARTINRELLEPMEAQESGQLSSLQPSEQASASINSR